MHKLVLAALALTLSSAAHAQYYRPAPPPGAWAEAPTPRPPGLPWWVPQALPPGSPEFRIPMPEPAPPPPPLPSFMPPSVRP